MDTQRLAWMQGEGWRLAGELLPAGFVLCFGSRDALSAKGWLAASRALCPDSEICPRSVCPRSEIAAFSEAA